MQPRSIFNMISVLTLGMVMVGASGCGGAQARKAKHMEKGQSFLVAGNFEKARVEFQNALQIAPTDADARFKNGVVDEKLGNGREAAQYYQGAIDANPDHAGARAALARLYLFAGAPERALELIKPGFDKHPDDAALLTVRAAARLQQKDTAGAQADAERAVQIAPDDEDAVAVLAGLYSANGESSKAQALLESSVKKIPRSVDLRLVLAQLYSSQNKASEAESVLLDLVRLKPDDKAHRIRLAQFYARANQPDAAERVLREGIKTLPAERELKTSLIDFLAARRSRDVAEKELLGMIASEPDDADLKFLLARFYEGVRESDKAAAVYKSVIDAKALEPAGLTARNRLAALLAQQNNIAGAKSLVDTVLNKSPRDNDALVLRGNLALLQQNPKAAIADLRAVLRDQPNAIGILRTLARAHMANGEPAIAEETMRRAVEANPKDIGIRLDFAQLLAQLNKAEQAKPILAQIVKEQPENLTALDTQFRVAMTTKDLLTAKSAADSIAASAPKAFEGDFYHGLIAEAEHRNEDALKDFTAASELRPDVAEPLQAQVRLLVMMKRTPEALKRLDELIARMPANAVAPNLKGELLMSLRRIAEAQAAFNASILRAPNWWVPYRNLAHAQLAANQSEAALATLRGGERTAEHPDALGVESGTLLESLGRTDEAIRQYEAVLKRVPDSSVAANNLAMLLATYKTDTASLDRARQLALRFADSQNPSFLDTYGWVLYKRGDAAASVPVLERVVVSAPDAAVARYHLGMAQSQLGSNSEARDNLSRAVRSGTKFSGLDEAKATLDKLAKLTPATSQTPRS